MSKSTKVRVSEKTLELNIAAELLAWIRTQPGCSKAFWIGMKQWQEAVNSIDELISNVPKGFHLALQFKAPKPSPPNGHPFSFTINDRQHANLVKLSNSRPRAVHYVLPHLNTFGALRKNGGSLLSRTVLLSVHGISGLAKATNKRGTHTIQSTPPSMLIRSDPMSVSVEFFSTEFGSALTNDQQAFLSSRELRNWIDESTILQHEQVGNADTLALDSRGAGQLFRGFGTIFVAR